MAALFVGRVLVVLCSVVSVRVYTQVLGAHEVGVMNLVLSAIGLFALLSGSIGQFFHQRVLEWYLRGQLLANSGRYLLFLFLFAAAVSLVMPFAYWFGDAAWRDIPLPWLLFLLSGTLIVLSLNNLMLYTLNATGARLSYALLSNITSWGGVAIALLTVFLVDAKAEYWLFGVLAGQMLSLGLAVLIVVRITRRYRSDQQADFSFRLVLSFSWPLVVCMAFYWLQRSSYGPMMAAMRDVPTLGLFSVAFSIGLLAMSSFDTLFKDYYSPIYYRAIADSSDEAKVAAWNEYADAFFPAIVVALLFTMFLAESLLQLLVAEEFRGLGEVVAWGALSQAVISVYSLYVVLASTFMNNRTLIAPNFWGAAVAVASLYFFLPYDPMSGTGLSIALGVSTTTLMVARKLRRHYAIKLPVRRAFLALVLAAPLASVWWVERVIWTSNSGARAVVLLLLAGGYVLLVQHRLARSWLPAVEYGARKPA